MGMTGLAGLWLAVLQFYPNAAWLALGPTVVFEFALAVGSIRPLFWCPLVACLNWVVLHFAAWWATPPAWWSTPPESWILIGLAILYLIAVSVFTIHQTRRKFRNSQKRGGVVFVSMGFGAFAGLLVGLMIGLPILIAGLLSVFIASPFDLDFAARIIGFPFFGSFAGFVVGIGLGFVCDVIVATDLKNEPRLQSAG